MRPAVAAGVLALVGCIGSNPEWNRPDGSVVTVGDASTGGGSNADSGGAATTVLTSAPSSDPSDGPSDEGPHESVEGATGSGSTTTTGTPSSAEAGDDTIATGPPSDDGADGVTTDGRPPSDDPPPPPCAPDEQLCAGVCTEIDHDKHACGRDCIDCTELYGNTARCEDGECEPHDGGGGEGKGD